MRRVLHVMASGARGGGARHVLGLLPRLQAAGLEVAALVGDDGPLAAQLAAAGIAADTLPLTGSRRDTRWLAWLEDALARFEPDLMHYHGTRAGFWGGCLRLVRADRRSIYTAHGLATRVPRRFYARPVFALAETVACRADAVISVSRADLQALVAAHRLAAHRGYHIGNAVDDPPRVAPSKRAARRRLGLPAEGLLVGCVARLVPQKAVGDLLDAMQTVSGARLVVIGDGPEAAVLARHPSVVAHKAILAGARDDVAACLPAFDVFALSSRWEGEPIALLEAMRAGLPCVATRTSGAVELLRHDATGRLVDPAEPARMGQALARLLGDPAARRRLGARARIEAQSHGWEPLCARTLQVYGRVLGDADLTRTAAAMLQGRSGAARAGTG